jgi:hypothetical protein
MIINNKEECDVKYDHVKGDISFSSLRHFVNLYSVTEDASTVMIDFEDALTLDLSAVAAIQGKYCYRFKKVDMHVLLTNLPLRAMHGCTKPAITIS